MAPNLIALMTAAALALAGCGGADAPDAVGPAGDAPPATGEDVKGDRTERAPAYSTSDGEALPASAHATLTAALDVLTRVSVEGSSGRQRTLAAETLARIAAGDVLLGSLETARGEDLWHMCRDLDAPERCGDRPPTEPEWAGDAALRAALPQALDGYQWGNRLYFAFDAADAEGLEPARVPQPPGVTPGRTAGSRHWVMASSPTCRGCCPPARPRRVSSRRASSPRTADSVGSRPPRGVGRRASRPARWSGTDPLSPPKSPHPSRPSGAWRAARRPPTRARRGAPGTA